MIEELSKEEHGMSGTVLAKLFDKNLEVWIEEGVSIENVNLCAKSLNSMGDNLNNKAGYFKKRIGIFYVVFEAYNIPTESKICIVREITGGESLGEK